MENNQNKQSFFTDPRFITTQNLIRELFSRFEHAIFCGIQENYELRDKYTSNYKGNKMVCIGLTKLVEDYMLKHLDLESRMIKKSLED